MLDKEKINEMASDMQYGCVKHDLWPSDAKEIAKVLIILGYQKVPENKVVFDRDDWQRWVYDIAEQSKKEMATKFYDKFNENISCFKLDKNVSKDYKEGYIQAIADICGRLDRTAVELGVDLEEYYGK